jgi:hypothetical protein
MQSIPLERPSTRQESLKNPPLLFWIAKSHGSKQRKKSKERFARVSYESDLVADWRGARDLLNDAGAVADVVREVRLVRMFRAADAIDAGLGTLWLETGTYKGAPEIIGRILDRERLLH